MIYHVHASMYRFGVLLALITYVVKKVYTHYGSVGFVVHCFMRANIGTERLNAVAMHKYTHSYINVKI